jgi:hypothetical protein
MTDGPCRSCGRAPCQFALTSYVNGEEVYRDPQGWVYAYREDRAQIGMCDQCFRAKRFDGLTKDEIEYFRENFDDRTDSRSDA